MKPHSSTRAVAAVSLMCSIWTTAACRQKAAANTEAVVQPQSIVQQELTSARGARYRLSTLTGGSKVFLVSFLDTQASPTGIENPPSRAQTPGLLSMLTQYKKQGLGLAIVHKPAPGAAPPTADALLNYTYDWNLGDVPVFADPAGALARHYAVVQVPTTLLLSSDGHVLRRWDGLAGPTALGPAFEAMFPRKHTGQSGQPPSGPEKEAEPHRQHGRTGAVPMGRPVEPSK